MEKIFIGKYLHPVQVQSFTEFSRGQTSNFRKIFTDWHAKSVTLKLTCAVHELSFEITLTSQKTQSLWLLLFIGSVFLLSFPRK